MRERLLTEMSTLQSSTESQPAAPVTSSSAKAPEGLAAIAGGLAAALQDVIEAPVSETAAEGARTDAAAAARRFAELSEKAEAIDSRIRALAALIEDKKIRAAALSEADAAKLRSEIALLEEILPLLQDELSRLNKEREEYEISFVGGRRRD